MVGPRRFAAGWDWQEADIANPGHHLGSPRYRIRRQRLGPVRIQQEEANMSRGIRIGRLLGIDIIIDYSWVLIFGLITLSLGQQYTTTHGDWSTPVRWGLAFVTSLLFFASVLAHELAHSAVSQAQGIPVPRITLFIFGGVSQISEEPRTAVNEFLMALVGPATSLLLAVVFGAIYFATGQGLPVINAAAGWLAGINLLLALFNLLPAFPLDGGRVLRAIVWGITSNLRRATQVAVGAGILLSWLMIGLGLWNVLNGNWVNGIWLAFIGWFLQGAAVQEGRVTVVHDILRGHAVREVLDSDCARVSPQLTVEAFVNDAAIPSGRRCFVVAEDNRFLGLLTTHRVNEVPRDRWGTTQVADVMIRPEALLTAHLDEDLTDALDRMGQADINQMPVIDNGVMVGLVTRAKILTFLRDHAAAQGIRVKTD
jgi:Zn-dependent protease/CBS domain-containing protein